MLAAALLAFTIFFYAVIYTMWLKRSTPQNIVIGGAAGAFPPMIGWAAATGSIGLEPVVLFAHHLLLDAAALLGAGLAARRRIFPRRRADAAGDGRPRRDPPADLDLLAVARAARRCALCAGLCRPAIYGVVATVGGAVFLALALRLFRAGDGAGRGRRGEGAVRIFDPLPVRAVRGDAGGESVQACSGNSVRGSGA